MKGRLLPPAAALPQQQMERLWRRNIQWAFTVKYEQILSFKWVETAERWMGEMRFALLMIVKTKTR